MRQLSFLKNLAIQTMLTMSVLGIVFPAPVFAAYIQVENNSGVNFRVIGKDSQQKEILKTLFTLPKKSIVEMPDTYLVDANNNPVKNSADADINNSINNWIQKANVAEQRYDDHGRLNTDYFLNVKVHQVYGSKKYKDQEGFVALKTLAATGSLKFTTIADTDFKQVQTKPSSKESILPKANSDLDKTEAAVCLGKCGQQNVLGDIVAQLNKINTVAATNLKTKKRYTKKVNALEDVQKETNKVLSRDRNKEFANVRDHFEKSCYGLKFDDFTKFVKEKSDANGIPSEMMMGIMTAESTGWCHSLGDKHLANKSLGLFQINSGSSSDRLCSDADYKALQGKSIAQMEKSTRCLQNPVVNLENAIRIYKDNYFMMNNKKLTTEKKVWSQLTAADRDDFRRALSGYNGGAKWAKIAADDIKDAAKKYGIALNNDWETMRLFYFRSILEQNGFMQKHAEGHRMYDFNVINIGYVDGILGREDGSKTQSGIIDRWETILSRNDQPSPFSVASVKTE